MPSCAQQQFQPESDQKAEKHNFEISDLKAMLSRAEHRLTRVEDDKQATTAIELPRLELGLISLPYIVSSGGIHSADPRQLLNEDYRKLSNGSRNSKTHIHTVKSSIKGADEREGNLTPEMKANLQLLNMRGVLDPHRHFKKSNGKSTAQTLQMGDFLRTGTSRLPNQKRTKTLIEEVLADESLTDRFQKKYFEIQAKKSSGKKAYYKKLKVKRSRTIPTIGD